jgi:hypothetical protein
MDDYWRPEDRSLGLIVWLAEGNTVLLRSLQLSVTGCAIVLKFNSSYTIMSS